MPQRVTLVLLLLTLLSGLTAPAQPINWDSVRADYVKKYQPQQVPAWLFPIIFEEGGGQRDTIYLGYDSNAKLSFGGSDTVFGEYKVEIDTTRFNTHWETNVNNRVAKTFVTNNLVPLSISFYKSRFPMTMHWDTRAFYNDSLPFYRDSINYPPNLPKAMGELWCSNLDPYYDNCMLGGTFPPFVMPADPNGYFLSTHDPYCNFIVPDLSQPGYAGASPCIASDSIVIFGDTTTGTASTPDWMPISSFVIKKYQMPVGIDERGEEDNINFYPNPFSGHAVLQVPGYGRYGADNLVVTIYDMTGRPLRQTAITSETTLISGEGLAQGVYFYRVVSGGTQIKAGKMMVQ